MASDASHHGHDEPGHKCYAEQEFSVVLSGLDLSILHVAVHSLIDELRAAAVQAYIDGDLGASREFQHQVDDAVVTHARVKGHLDNTWMQGFKDAAPRLLDEEWLGNPPPVGR